jgi:TetR/AcrR family transcriptional regulator, transcriptional repressor for nem operon
MGRVKEFDRDQAVARAAGVFWDQGFERTSTEDLLRAMGIGRQSMYDTFGGKRNLYLEALRHYQASAGADLLGRLRAAASPLSALSDVLLAVARQSASDRARGCLAVNAATEFGRTDPGVSAFVDAGVTLCQATFERVLAEAKAKGEVRADVDERAGARFLHATLVGMRVSARSGAPAEVLRDIATTAIDGLRAA